MLQEVVASSFTEWALAAEPRLRHALTAAFGSQVGVDATAEALSLAWERWDQLKERDDPLGYVFGIGRNVARRSTKQRPPALMAVPADRLPDVEPGLPEAIARLSEQQRTVVGLLYGYEWTMSEVAELLGIAKTSVQNHAERALAQLRETLGVNR